MNKKKKDKVHQLRIWVVDWDVIDWMSDWDIDKLNWLIDRLTDWLIDWFNFICQMLLKSLK